MSKGRDATGKLNKEGDVKEPGCQELAASGVKKPLSRELDIKIQKCQEKDISRERDVKKRKAPRNRGA